MRSLPCSFSLTTVWCVAVTCKNKLLSWLWHPLEQAIFKKWKEKKLVYSKHDNWVKIFPVTAQGQYTRAIALEYMIAFMGFHVTQNLGDAALHSAKNVISHIHEHIWRRVMQSLARVTAFSKVIVQECCPSILACWQVELKQYCVAILPVFSALVISHLPFQPHLHKTFLV